MNATLEAELTRLLGALFTPEELHRFIRHRVDETLADALPPARYTARVHYSAQAARRLLEWGRVTEPFFAALLEKRDGRASEIRRLASRMAVAEPPATRVGRSGQGSDPTPRYRDDEARLLGERLERACARRQRLERAGADATGVVGEILELKRALRRGGQVQAGDRLGHDRYLLLEQLGQGGFATVWRAIDSEAGDEQPREVAIKVLHSNLSHDPIRRERFFRGARVMAKLDHPGIVELFESHGEDDGYHYLVMELVAQGSLDRAFRDGTMTPEKALALILDVGHALAAAHQHGHVHRDIKPGNILITETGRAKLCDFDLVAAVDSTGGTRTGALGTFVYAAPEQLERPQDADARADIYSLAMTTVFALHGRSLPQRAVRDAPGFIAGLDCSEAVAEVLIRAVRWNRDERHGSMDEFCRALARAASSSPPRRRSTEPGDSDAALRAMQLSSLPLPAIRKRRAVRWSRLAPVVAAAVLATAYSLMPEPTQAVRFLAIEGGELWMGSAGDEQSGDHGGRETRHRVRVSNFELASTEVTQAQWRAIMGDNPSDCEHGCGDDLPVQNVSWRRAVVFLNQWSARDGRTPCYEFVDATTVRWNQTCDGYRLPTEAEWEYACRAGTTTAYAHGDASDQLGTYAWYDEGPTFEVHPVASKAPNPWGLHDMHGNVWEWVWDWYAPYPTEGVQRDPVGPDDTAAPVLRQSERVRVLRGGSAWSSDRSLRCANRFKHWPSDEDDDFGLRAARNPRRLP